jgi:lysophospholipase L1-like esterase
MDAAGGEGSRRSWVLALSLGLAGVGGTLLLGEAIVRAFDLGPRFGLVSYEIFEQTDDPVLGYVLRPGAPDGEHRISEAGLRDREFPLAKADGVFRVAAIGDSITFGHGFSREESWPKQLESMLAAAALPAAPRFEVINFGVTGYNLGQIAERLRTLVLRYDPDLVVYGYTLNDPQAYSFEATILDGLARAREPDPRSAARGLSRALAHSRLFLMARQLLVRGDGGAKEIELRLDPGFVADARGRRERYFRGLHRREAARRRFEGGLARIGAIARESGVPAVLAIFPLFYDDPSQPYGLADVHDLVAAEARANGLEVLDLRPAFDAARERVGVPLHADMMHPNALGHRVAARALLGAMAAREPGLVDARADVAPDAPRSGR